jgi:hypothetical protein
VSHKRILGWEPTETHEYRYDDEGRVSSVVVSREAEWDDVERANMLALADYEADLCHCGLPSSLADTDPDLQVKYRECPVCAGLAKVTRIQAAEDAALTKQVYGVKGPQPGDELPQDGRHFIGFEAPESGGRAVDHEENEGGE